MNAVSISQGQLLLQYLLALDMLHNPIEESEEATAVWEFPIQRRSSLGATSPNP